MSPAVSTGTTVATPLVRSTFGGRRSAPEQIAELRRSGAGEAPEVLMDRLATDGYLYLPGYLDRARVLAARAELLGALDDLGWLAEGVDPAAAKPGSGPRTPFDMNELARTSPTLLQVLYEGRMIELYDALFGEPTRHFDFTWLRVVGPGGGTPPHMDNVFMNRGTNRLLTAWTPLGDISTELGGLAVLEGSHRETDLTDDYAQRDVDTYCANSEDPDELQKADLPTLAWSGRLTDDAVGFGNERGLRWLTTNYRAGDLLTFTMLTAHTGLDNNADQFRLSTDSRYQPGTEPADHRWIGAKPTAHGAASKLGLIC